MKQNKVVLIGDKVYVTKDIKHKIYEHISSQLRIDNDNIQQILTDNDLQLSGLEKTNRKNKDGSPRMRKRYQVKIPADVFLDTDEKAWVYAFAYKVPVELRSKLEKCQKSAKAREKIFENVQYDASIQNEIIVRKYKKKKHVIRTFPYFGSKANQFSEIEYALQKAGLNSKSTLLDGFGGSGIVGLNMNYHYPKLKVIYNDLNSENANFFEVMKDNCKYQELFEKIKETECDSVTFSNALKMRKDYLEGNIELTEIERALNHYVCYSMCRNGVLESGFSSGTERIVTYNNGKEKLEELHKQLQGIKILNNDILDLIPVYDKPDTIMYLDIPYLDILRTAGGYECDNGNLEFQKKFLNTIRKVKNANVLIAGYYDKDNEKTDKCDYNAILGEGWYQTKEGIYSKSTSSSQNGKPKAEEILWSNFSLGENISVPCLV